MRLILLGPPGVGKGTQAQLLAQRYDALHLSTGDILRRHCSERTPLGHEAKQFMDRGELVPDALIIAMVESELIGKTSFILDGFPRTVPQASALDGMLVRLRQPLSAVVLFNASRETLMARLTSRWVNPRTGRVYNTLSTPPAVHGIDDHDGSLLEQRIDDQPVTVAHRLDVYDSQTAPLVAYYEGLGRLVRVDAEADVSDVTREIVANIDALGLTGAIVRP